MLQRQYGMVSRAQALAVGLSQHQVDRLVAARRWLPIYPGVYLAADRGLTEEGRVWATALWAGDEATVSGLTAAWWHRLWRNHCLLWTSRYLERAGSGALAAFRSAAVCCLPWIGWS